MFDINLNICPTREPLLFAEKSFPIVFQIKPLVETFILSVWPLKKPFTIPSIRIDIMKKKKTTKKKSNIKSRCWKTRPICFLYSFAWFPKCQSDNSILIIQMVFHDLKQLNYFLRQKTKKELRQHFKNFVPTGSFSHWLNKSDKSEKNTTQHNATH